MTYTIEEHRHRFAGWSAARAAQRGMIGGDNTVLLQAIEGCGVREAVHPPVEWSPDAAEFDRAHAGWCRHIVASLRERGLPHHTATFGRAAKLVAIYLKSMVVLAGRHETSLGRMLHPPIDNILLTSLAEDDDANFREESRQLWRRTRWTKLDETGYAQIIQSLRAERLDDPFWGIERYWIGHSSRERAGVE